MSGIHSFKTVRRAHSARVQRSLQLETLENREVFAAGDLDTSWGGDGIVDLTGGAAAGHDVRATSSAIFAGSGSNKITKLNTNGTVDATFGTSGTATASYRAWSVQSTGNAVLARTNTSNLPNEDGEVTRLTTSGAVDTSFGASGTRLLDFTSDLVNPSSYAFTADRPVSLEVASNDKIWVGANIDAIGAPFPNGSFLPNHAIGIARLTSTGALDATFSTNGMLTIEVPSGTQVKVKGITLVGTGNNTAALVTAVEYGDTDFFAKLVIYKVNASGALDNTFGTAGKLEVTNLGVASSATDLVDINGTFETLVSSTSEIYVGAYAVDNTLYALKMLNFSSAGVLDTSFGSAGILAINNTPSNSGDAPEFGMALQADDLPILAYDTSSWKVSRFDSAGGLDTTFGSGGTVTTNVGSNPNPQSVRVMSSGQILVAGRSGTGGTTITVARYLAADVTVSSSVTALPATTYSNSIDVSWSGTSTGGGTLTYDVYYKVGAGNFVLWQNGTSATSATLSSTVLNTFNINSARRKSISFYSVAHSSTGASEANSGTADTTTDYVGAPRQNPFMQFDVDANGTLNVNDILRSIFEYQTRQYSIVAGDVTIPPDPSYVNGAYPDVDGNNFINVNDILLSINDYVVRVGSGESPASGEAPAIAAPVARAARVATPTTSAAAAPTSTSNDPPAAGSSSNDLALLALFTCVEDEEA